MLQKNLLLVFVFSSFLWSCGSEQQERSTKRKQLAKPAPITKKAPVEEIDQGNLELYSKHLKAGVDSSCATSGCHLSVKIGSRALVANNDKVNLSVLLAYEQQEGQSLWGIYADPNKHPGGDQSKAVEFLDFNSWLKGETGKGVPLSFSVFVSGLTSLGGTLSIGDDKSNSFEADSDGEIGPFLNYEQGDPYNLKVVSASDSVTCIFGKASGDIIYGELPAPTLTCEQPKLAMSGITKGLSGSVTISLGPNQDFIINENGEFSFATELERNSTFDLTVKTQPNGQTCYINNVSGSTTAKGPEQIDITCTSNAGNTYTLGGEVTGLAGTLVLSNSGIESKMVTTNGSYTFASTINEGAAYSVSITSAPADQTCTIVNNSGTVIANISSINIECMSPIYSLGGKVTGLASGQSVSLNGTGNSTLTVSANETFAFPSKLAKAATYAVAIDTNPTSGTCTVMNEGGVLNADVDTVEVVCTGAFVELVQTAITAECTDCHTTTQIAGSTLSNTNTTSNRVVILNYISQTSAVTFKNKMNADPSHSGGTASRHTLTQSEIQEWFDAEDL